MATKTKTIVRLNRIPERFVTDLLPISAIGKLELVHKKKAAFTASAFAFAARRVPPLRLADAAFAFEHRLDEAVDVPLLRVFDKAGQLRETVEAGTLSEEQLEARVVEVDRLLQQTQ